MNRSFYLLFFILWLPYFGVAQAEPGIDTQFKQITYTGKIVDAETQEPLPFAQINHIYKFTDKDSLIVRNFIADKDGKFEFQSPRVMNNRIEVICLGYKIHTRILSEAGNQIRNNITGMIEVDLNKQHPQIYNQVDLGILKLTPDVQQLDEVVVKARIKLFEMSGDTLMVFPKNIKQFEGETLADILKRLPNFYVDKQGDIYVDGKKIERAMLNNKHIFGEDVRTMVTSIMAKEAGLIKVYDEIDEISEILQGKGFARKRKVMNVITFKDFDMFKGGEVHLESGRYADKETDVKQQTMHHASGKIGQYATNFRIAVLGNTTETALPQRKQETGAGINAEVSTSDLLKLIGFNYNYDKNDQEQESRTEQFYFPTAYFDSQIAERSNNNQQNKNMHKFGLSGKYVKKSVFSLTGSYSGDVGNASSQSQVASNLIKDGEQLSFLQQIRECNGRNDKHSMMVDMTKSLKELGSIQLNLSGNMDQKSEEGVRVDTSYSEGLAEKQIFNTFKKNPYYKMDAKLTFQKNLKKFAVGCYSSISYGQIDRSDRVVNCLTGEIDSTTTQDQMQKKVRISNSIFCGIRLKDEGMIVARVDYNIYRYQLEEQFPENLQMNKSFHPWNVWINVLLDQFRFSFQTSDNPFFVPYLSPRFKDDNPMNLSVGNSNLKMGKNYIWGCDVDLKEVLRLKLEYKIVTNPILQSRRYFATNTLLPEFGNYKALAGAVLVTPVNAKNYNYFNMSVHSNSKKGVVLLRGFLDYIFENPQTDLMGEIVRSYTHRANVSLSLISNFSSMLRLDIADRVMYSHTKINAGETQKNSWIGNHLVCNANLQIRYRMMINTSYSNSCNYNSQTKKTDNIQTLNASIDYRIFSNRRGVISLNARNLFNTKSSLTTSSTVLYIQNTYRPENSTLFSVSFRYKFGAE